jgi:hypothetical protein
MEGISMSNPTPEQQPHILSDAHDKMLDVFEDYAEDLLVTAGRQYQHNDCSGLVHGYDAPETRRIVGRLKAALDAEKKLSQAISNNCNSVALERNQLRDRVQRLEGVFQAAECFVPDRGYEYHLTDCNKAEFSDSYCDCAVKGLLEALSEQEVSDE